MEFTPLNKWLANLKRPLVIAGPCSAESEEQVLATARELKGLEDVRIFRAGIWKPRTRPGSFEGVGEEGLAWMEKVKAETGLLTCVEVANARHVDLALKHNIDILWIGARTTVNPFSVQEIADRLKGVNIPVMIKNPINVDLALWEGAIERIYNAGVTKIVAIHRGFATGEKTVYRNRPLWRVPIELKRRFPDLPIVCDPSHISGNRDLIQKVCQKAMDVDMEGLMIETHINPKVALSDAAQQVTPSQLNKIIKSLSLRTEFSADRNFESELETLREKIDRVDTELMDVLKMRMDIVENIGKLKRDNNVTAFQVHRMQKLMDNRIAHAHDLGLREDYVREIYNVIHDESVKRQTDILNNVQENGGGSSEFQLDKKQD